MVNLDERLEFGDISVNQSRYIWSGLSGTATARSTAGVNVSNKSQETIDRVDVFSAFSQGWQQLGGDNVVG